LNILFSASLPNCCIH